jgi:PAS domain S-box-containing protein
MLLDLSWLEFWRFHDPLDQQSVLATEYSPVLVALSLLVAVLAAFAAWAVVDRIVESRRPFTRRLWLWSGATVLGTGIWAMHFLGMLAFRLPLPVTYRPWITLGSALPAILGSAVALRVMSRESVSLLRMAAASLALAVAIGTMHYVGMEALSVHAQMHYRPVLFGLSIAVAYLLAFIALYVRFAANRDKAGSRFKRIVAATVTGLAVAGMHYTAMASVHFHLMGVHDSLPGAEPVLLAILVCVFVLFILGVTLIGTIVDQKLLAASDSLMESGMRHTAVLRSMVNGLMLLDENGRIETANAASARLFDYSENALLGLSIEGLVPGCMTHLPAMEGASTPARHSGFETVARTRTGQEIPLEVVLSPVVIGERNLYSAILLDITERRAARAALEDARDRAEAGARAKAEFLATMSHEIRTPMNGVLGMTHILLDTQLNQEQREFVETISTSGQALLTIINDILDFSKIEAGKLDLEPIPFDSHTVIAEAVDLMLPSAESKGLELAVSIDPTGPRHVIGDPGRLRQILLNLISNAIKFTASGHVLIELTGRTDSSAVVLRFSVSDTGIGMDQVGRSRLFAQFSQADASTTRRYGGTGLGLAICKRLVEMMEGAIGVDSVPGQGSTFWFEVRLEPAARPQTQDITAKFAGQRVLIVDDSQINLKILQRQLEAWGLRASPAFSSREALDLLRQADTRDDRFAFGIIDLHMPEVDGLTLGRHIRANQSWSGIKLLLLTSSGRRGDCEQARNAGYSGFLVKPAPPDTLRGVLHTMLTDTEEQIVTRYMVTPPVVPEKSGPAAAALTPTAAGTGYRVLLAEDNAVNQRVAVLMLKRLGCRVDVASNGLEALEFAEKLPYDIIFLDCHMPELDGFGAARAIRARETDGQRIPIIALTANVMEEDRERCLVAGMDDFLSKPVSAQNLADTLRRHTSGARTAVNQ